MSEPSPIHEEQNQKRAMEAQLKVITLDEHERTITKVLRDQKSRYPANVLQALAKAQIEIFNPCKNRTVSVQGKEGRGGFAYEYAELNVVTEIIRQPCAKNGLSVMQTVVPGDRGMYVMTIIGHASGDVIEFRYPLFIEESQRMKADQSFAAAFTYAKRQALKGIFAIADDTEDRDGQDGNPNVTVTPKDKKPSTPSKAQEKKPDPPKSGPVAKVTTPPKVTAAELGELAQALKVSQNWTAESLKTFSKKAFGVEDSKLLTKVQFAQVKQALEMTFDGAISVFATEPPEEPKTEVKP